MSQEGEMPVSVTLSESNWKAILWILRVACLLKGDDWMRWQQGVSQSVLAAIEETRAASLTPSATKTKETYSHYEPTCPECGGPFRQIGTDYNLAQHIYECGRCGYSSYNPMSREEMIEEGDYSFLEDWEMHMVDDL